MLLLHSSQARLHRARSHSRDWLGIPHRIVLEADVRVGERRNHSDITGSTKHPNSNLVIVLDDERCAVDEEAIHHGFSDRVDNSMRVCCVRDRPTSLLGCLITSSRHNEGVLGLDSIHLRSLLLLDREQTVR